MFLRVSLFERRSLVFIFWNFVFQSVSLEGDIRPTGQEFHITERFIIVFTRDHHWTLVLADLIQLISLRSILILVSLPNGIFHLYFHSLSTFHPCFSIKERGIIDSHTYEEKAKQLVDRTDRRWQFYCLFIDTLIINVPMKIMPMFSACTVDADGAPGDQLVLRLGDGLNSQGTGIRFPTGTTFPLPTAFISWFHPASYKFVFRWLFPQR
jgi:hypothetical protein